MLAAAQASLPLFEYTPLQVKQALAGYGRADKRQIQEMVKLLLKLKECPQPDDVADALAIAICPRGFGWNDPLVLPLKFTPITHDSSSEQIP